MVIFVITGTSDELKEICTSHFFFLDYQQVAGLGTSSPLPPLPLGWSRGKNHRKSENGVQITYDKWNDNLISLSIKKYFDCALSLKLFC